MLFRQSMRRRRDDVAIGDQGIQIDHIAVVVEEVDGGLSGDARRKGSDGGEDCSFRHVGPAVTLSVYMGLSSAFPSIL